MTYMPEERVTEERAIGAEFYSEFSRLLSQADSLEKEIKRPIIAPKLLLGQIVQLINNAAKLQQQAKTQTFTSREEQEETTEAITDFMSRLNQLRNNKKLIDTLEMFSENKPEQPKPQVSRLRRFFNIITAPFVWLATPFVWLYERIKGREGSPSVGDESQTLEVKHRPGSVGSFSKLGPGGRSISEPNITISLKKSVDSKSSRAASQSTLFSPQSSKGERIEPFGEKADVTPDLSHKRL